MKRPRLVTAPPPLSPSARQWIRRRRRPRRPTARRRAAEGSIGDWLTRARTDTTNVLIIGAVLVLIVFLAREIPKRVIVVEPLGVPPELEQQGYGRDVIARMIGDRMAAIRRRASTYMQQPNVVMSPFDDAPDLEVPRAGVSLQNVVRFSRGLLGYSPTRISGEVTLDSGMVQLRVRVSNGPVSDSTYAVYRLARNAPAPARASRDSGPRAPRYSAPIALFDELVDSAARAVLLRTEPFRLASYAYELRDTTTARAIAVYCLAHTPRDDDAYAHNMLGLLLEEATDFEGATRQYHLAALQNPHLVLPYHNIAHVLYTQGRLLEARTYVDSALERDRHYAQALNLKGLLLAAEHRNADAAGHFAAALREDPTNPYAFRNWGDLLLSMGHPREALLKYQEGLDQHPDDPSLHFAVGAALAKQSLDLGVKEFERGLALAEQRHAHERGPLDVSGYAALATVLRDGGRAAAALAVLQRAARLDSTHVDALLAEGEFFGTSIPPVADSLFRRAAQLEPTDGRVYLSWGRALVRRRRPTQAITQFFEAVRLRPDDAEAHERLASALGDSALLLRYQHRDQDARRLSALSDSHYREAIRRDPGLIRARIDWADDLAVQREYGRADSVLVGAARYDPWNARIITVRASILRDQGRFREADVNFSRSWNLDSVAFGGFESWGYSLLQLGRYAEAADKYARSDRRGPMAAHSYHNWGVALDALHRTDEAVKLWQTAIQADPTLADPYLSLGEWMDQRGRTGEAAAMYRRAIAADSASDAAQEARERLSRIQLAQRSP